MKDNVCVKQLIDRIPYSLGYWRLSCTRLFGIRLQIRNSVTSMLELFFFNCQPSALPAHLDACLEFYVGLSHAVMF